MSPTRSGKNGRRYRYYVSQAVLQHQPELAGTMPRLPAHDLEQLVSAAVLKALADEPATRKIAAADKHASEENRTALLKRTIRRIEVHGKTVNITVDIGGALQERSQVPSGESKRDSLRHLHLPISVAQRRGVVRITEPGSPEEEPDNSTLIKAIARGFYWREQLITGEAGSVREIADRSGVSDRYVSHILRLGFCPPALIANALSGKLAAAQSKSLLNGDFSGRIWPE